MTDVQWLAVFLLGMLNGFAAGLWVGAVELMRSQELREQARRRGGAR